MSFASRAAVSLLAGVGAGLLGFWAVWTAIKLLGESPATVPDAWPLTGILGPGVLVPLAVFRAVSRAVARVHSAA